MRTMLLWPEPSAGVHTGDQKEGMGLVMFKGVKLYVYIGI